MGNAKDVRKCGIRMEDITRGVGSLTFYFFL
jgi:hypothetical protein